MPVIVALLIVLSLGFILASLAFALDYGQPAKKAIGYYLSWNRGRLLGSTIEVGQQGKRLEIGERLLRVAFAVLLLLCAAALLLAAIAAASK